MNCLVRCLILIFLVNSAESAEYPIIQKVDEGKALNSTNPIWIGDDTRFNFVMGMETQENVTSRIPLENSVEVLGNLYNYDSSYIDDVFHSKSKFFSIGYINKTTHHSLSLNISPPKLGSFYGSGVNIAYQISKIFKGESFAVVPGIQFGIFETRQAVKFETVVFDSIGKPIDTLYGQQDGYGICQGKRDRCAPQFSVESRCCGLHPTIPWFVQLDLQRSQC